MCILCDLYIESLYAIPSCPKDTHATLFLRGTLRSFLTDVRPDFCPQVRKTMYPRTFLCENKLQFHVSLGPILSYSRMRCSQERLFLCYLCVRKYLLNIINYLLVYIYSSILLTYCWFVNIALIFIFFCHPTLSYQLGSFLK